MIVWLEKLLISRRSSRGRDGELFVSSCSDLLTSKEIVEKVKSKVESRKANGTLNQTKKPESLEIGAIRRSNIQNCKEGREPVSAVWTNQICSVFLWGRARRGFAEGERVFCGAKKWSRSDDDRSGRAGEVEMWLSVQYVLEPRKPAQNYGV